VTGSGTGDLRRRELNAVGVLSDGELAVKLRLLAAG
jgi:hypothetical protein